MQYYLGSINELLDAFKEKKEVIDQITDFKKILDEIRTRSQQNRGMISIAYNEANTIDSLDDFLSHRNCKGKYFSGFETSFMRFSYKKKKIC